MTQKEKEFISELAESYTEKICKDINVVCWKRGEDSDKNTYYFTEEAQDLYDNLYDYMEGNFIIK